MKGGITTTSFYASVRLKVTIFTYEAFMRLGGLSSQVTNRNIERGLDMLERLTDRARLTIVFAQQEAKLLVHNHVGTGHLLLGLLHEGEGTAAEALHRIRMNLDDVREAVGDIVPRADILTAHAPFTPNTRRVLDCSLAEAKALGVEYIGTEHILLALLSEESRDGGLETTAQKVFVARGVNLEAAREIVLVDFLGVELVGED